MLTAGDVQFFRENGYLPARPLLTPEEVGRLRERFYALLEGSVSGVMICALNRKSV